MTDAANQSPEQALTIIDMNLDETNQAEINLTNAAGYALNQIKFRDTKIRVLEEMVADLQAKLAEAVAVIGDAEQAKVARTMIMEYVRACPRLDEQFCAGADILAEVLPALLKELDSEHAKVELLAQRIDVVDAARSTVQQQLKALNDPLETLIADYPDEFENPAEDVVLARLINEARSVRRARQAMRAMVQSVPGLDVLLTSLTGQKPGQG